MREHRYECPKCKSMRVIWTIGKVMSVPCQNPTCNGMKMVYRPQEGTQYQETTAEPGKIVAEQLTLFDIGMGVF